MRLITGTIIVISFITQLIYYANCSVLNVTEHLAREHLSRQKRFLLFGGGAFRMVAGTLAPVKFREIKKQWQDAYVYFTFSSGWALPDKPLYWWDQRPLDKSRRLHATTQSRSMEYFNQKLVDGIPSVEDSSRKLIYDYLEAALTSNGVDGRECICRAICETADSPMSHNGVFGEIWDAVFSPQKGDGISNIYAAAAEAGKSVIKCIETYPRCPVGHGVLEKYAQFIES